MCVIRPSCTTSWLIVPWSGPVVMRVTQYQTKETASLEDSSPLAESVTAPSPHGRPLTDAHPLPPPPPLSSLPLVFSNLHAGQNTRLLLHAKPSQKKLRDPGAQGRNPEQRVNGREGTGRESGRSKCSCLCSSWRRPSCGSINDFFVWFVAECPLFQPPGNSLRPAAVVSPGSFSFLMCVL